MGGAGALLGLPAFTATRDKQRFLVKFVNPPPLVVVNEQSIIRTKFIVNKQDKKIFIFIVNKLVICLRFVILM